MAADLILLDGQTLNGSDRFGDWKMNALEGWWDSPDPKGEEVDRAQADGDFDLEVFYKARYITITGRLFSPSHDQLHEAINRFTGLVRKNGRLQVSGHGPTQWANVKRASGFSITPVTDRFAHWQVRLKAVDPRKFGELRTFRATSTAEALVYHSGNYDAAGRFTVRGSFPDGFTIWVAGQPTVITQGMQTGPLIIDYDDGRLRSGTGALITGKIARSALTKVPGGTALAVGLTGNGSGTVDVEVLDTYI